jgi:hypothetical protein
LKENAMRCTIMMLVLAGLLAGCNLQAITPAPPPTAATETPPALDEAPTRTPPAQATLIATPTQFSPLLPAPPLPVTLDALGGAVPAPVYDPATADDRYEVTTRPGQALAIVYEATVTQGSLGLVIQGPGGVIWQRTLTASENSRADFTIEQGGMYELLVFRQGFFDGSYAFRWE